MTENKNPKKIRFGTCSKDCYGSCVFRGIWNDSASESKFLSAHPLKEHPFTNGFFCPKFKQREDLIYHQERLKHPLIRKGPKAEKEHTKWIVFCVSETYSCSFHELSRSVRLAHNIRANMLWAVVDDDNNVTYYEIKFLRI